MEIDKMQHLEVIPQKYWIKQRFEKNEENSLIIMPIQIILRALRKTLIEGEKAKGKEQNTPFK